MNESIFSKATKVRETVEDFVQWWLSELYACVPLTLRTKISQKKPRAWLSIFPNGLELQIFDKGSAQDPIHLPSLENLQHEEWQKIASDLDGRQSIIILEHPFFYLSNLTISKSGYHYAKRIVDLHINRLSPVNIERITWNWNIISDSSKIVAQIAIIKNEYLAKIDELFDAYQIAMPSIAVRSGASYIPIRKGVDASVSPQQRRDRNLYLAAATIIFAIPVLMIAVLSVLNASTNSENRSLESQVADQLDIDLMRRQTFHDQMVAAPIASVPLVSRLFEQFARRLPPEVRLKSLRVQADGIVIVEVAGGNADQFVENLATEFAAVTRLTDTESTPSPTGDPAATSFRDGPALPVRLEIRR